MRRECDANSTGDPGLTDGSQSLGQSRFTLTGFILAPRDAEITVKSVWKNAEGWHGAVSDFHRGPANRGYDRSVLAPLAL